MATRYKKIRINDLRQGQGQVYYDDGKKMFYQSKGVDVDFETGRLRLAQAMPKFTHVDFFTYNSNGNHICRLNPPAGYWYSFALYFDHTADRLKLYWYQTTNETLKLTFAATFTEGYYILGYKQKLIVQTLDGGVVKIGYSTDGGANFTHAAWTYGKIIRQTTDDTGKLWVITATGYIVTTTDGITWTSFFYDGVKYPVEIGFLDGFIYLIISNSGTMSADLARIENDVIRHLTDLHSEMYAVSMIVQEDRRLLISKVDSSNKCRIYEWTKGELSEIGFLEPTNLPTSCRFLCGNRKAVYLCLNGRYIYKINRYNGIFYLYDATVTIDANAFVISGCINDRNSVRDGDLSLIVQTGDGVTSGTTHAYQSSVSNATIASGTVEFSIIDVGGHAAGHLIVRHNPLTATSSLVVKAKQNKAATFATTLLTSNTTSAIKKAIDLKSVITASQDYIQFELTLADSGLVDGIKEIEIIYLYVPSGIENAQ